MVAKIEQKGGFMSVYEPQTKEAKGLLRKLRNFFTSDAAKMRQETNLLERQAMRRNFLRERADLTEKCRDAGIPNETIMLIITETLDAALRYRK